MTVRTGAARAVFWLSGKVSRIKTYQRYHPFEGFDEETNGIKFGKPGRHWFSCGLTWKLLRLSCRIDPNHWDHWALEHDCCAGDLCSCGGRACTWECDEGNLD